METKACRDCGGEYPATAEYFHRRGAGKLNTYCKPCACARATRHYLANHESGLLVRAAYREAHREQSREYHRHPTARRIEQKRLSGQRLRARLGDALRSRQRERYLRSVATYVERARLWQLRNPDKMRAHVRSKNHRRRGVPFTQEARAYVAILVNDPCCYCGQRTRIEIDHVQPVSKGGNGDWFNLSAACGPCNRRRSNRGALALLMDGMRL